MKTQSNLILTEDTIIPKPLWRGLYPLPNGVYVETYSKPGATGTGKAWRQAINESIARRLHHH